MWSPRIRTQRCAAFDYLEARQLLTLTMTPVQFTAVQNTNFSGIIALLGDLTLHASPSEFNTPPGSVQINWGDGQTTPGTVIGPVTLPGAFEVTGSHTYVQPGVYSVTVNVSDNSGDDATALSTATVTAQPFVINVNTISARRAIRFPPMDPSRPSSLPTRLMMFRPTSARLLTGVMASRRSERSEGDRWLTLSAAVIRTLRQECLQPV